MYQNKLRTLFVPPAKFIGLIDNKIQIFQDREIKERLGKEQESKGTLM